MNSLKKSFLGKKVRMYWTSYKNNSDILDRIQRKTFARSYKIPTLPPPTETEKRLIDDLHQRMAQLPIATTDASTPLSEITWTKYKNELREDILSKDPREFASWYIVHMNMGASLRRRPFLELLRMPFWKEWAQKIIARPLIYQYPYFKFTKTDGTTLSHTYHLAQLKSRLDVDVEDMDFIVEFGGGYGSMCALAYSLGFKGRYVIYDWPELILLQEFYLKLQGFDTSTIAFVSDMQSLVDAVGNKRGLFIATWSLSEAPVSLRTEFMKHINPDYYLFGYQRSFGEVNDHDYFLKFREERKDTQWVDIPIHDLPGIGNRYLLGRPRS